MDSLQRPHFFISGHFRERLFVNYADPFLFESSNDTMGSVTMRGKEIEAELQILVNRHKESVLPSNHPYRERCKVK